MKGSTAATNYAVIDLQLERLRRLRPAAYPKAEWDEMLARASESPEDVFRKQTAAMWPKIEYVRVGISNDAPK